MLEESFEIKLPQFEGPFDLLLFFIERDELDIHNIPIAKITDDFLEYIHQMSALNIELASEFILVAATLMRIKAKLLLPRPELDEEGNEIDYKKDLVEKLIEYKKFKQLCEGLKVLEEERSYKYRRGNIQSDNSTVAEYAQPGEELQSFDLFKLLTIYNRLMRKYELRGEEVTHTVIQYPYTIEEQKKTISRLLEINKKLKFEDIFANSENKVHFVYNFLALLEMLQQQLINIQVGLGYNNFNVSVKE